MKQAKLVVGVQSGDEGKGKIVDMLSEEQDFVVRYQGGGNAGHTVVRGGKKYALHNIPSGILYPKVENVCGSGMVLDLEGLTKEMAELRSKGISLDNLKISTKAHLILPYHPLSEKTSATSKAIDTTGRGIGPAYTDKIARNGIRMGDLLNPEYAIERMVKNCDEYNAIAAMKGGERVDKEELIERAFKLFQGLRPHLADTRRILYDALREGKNVLLEGAQATGLDIDWGTYPHVTSSNTTAGGACTGTGLPPKMIGKVIGIMKAYFTRIGNGPFPTEENNDIGDKIRADGAEFGTTTGRPRRCGWLDLVQARYAIEINGIDEIALMKLDVLDTQPVIKVCTSYSEGGTSMPDSLDGVEPFYKEFKGWMTPTRDCRKWEDLPDKAKKYIDDIETKLGVPIKCISVGPDREQTIRR